MRGRGFGCCTCSLAVYIYEPVTHRPPSLTAWLWWWAVILLLGSAAAWYVLLRQPMADTDLQEKARLAVTVAGSLAGICVISATANWWIHR